MIKLLKQLKNKLISKQITPTDAMKQLADQLDNDALLSEAFDACGTDWGANLLPIFGEQLAPNKLYCHDVNSHLIPLNVETAVDIINYLTNEATVTE